MATPFKMKGSPMARNFGVSTMKVDPTDKKVEKSSGSNQEVKVENSRNYVDSSTGEVNSAAMERLNRAKPAADSPGFKGWQKAYDKAKKRDQGL